MSWLYEVSWSRFRLHQPLSRSIQYSRKQLDLSKFRLKYNQPKSFGKVCNRLWELHRQHPMSQRRCKANRLCWIQGWSILSMSNYHWPKSMFWWCHQLSQTSFRSMLLKLWGILRRQCKDKRRSWCFQLTHLSLFYPRMSKWATSRDLGRL